MTTRWKLARAGGRGAEERCVGALVRRRHPLRPPPLHPRPCLVRQSAEERAKADPDNEELRVQLEVRLSRWSGWCNRARAGEERATRNRDASSPRSSQIQRARLRVELARLEAEGVVSDQDVPLREEDLALLHAAEAAVGRVEAEVEFDPETRRAWRDALARVQRPDARA